MPARSHLPEAQIQSAAACSSLQEVCHLVVKDLRLFDEDHVA
jgi:hypothetical protein